MYIVKRYKTKYDIAICIGLIVELRSRLLVLSITNYVILLLFYINGLKMTRSKHVATIKYKVYFTCV
jgi:hypothetical protein